eukprot:5279484-Prorocentrum_lima.AAC.1
MTSSLVGSEMCIRDSLVIQIYESPVLRISNGMPVVSWRRYQAKQSSTSVSYTHLTLPTICSV